MNSQVVIPQVGFGVFEISSKDAERTVLAALEAGYRHIDTAAAYYNEREVGLAISGSGIPRDELFVTTKQRPNDQATDLTRPAIEQSLEALALDYVDLYLIHWPVPLRNHYVESWHALECFLAEGLTRSIGVSNFLPEHLDRLRAESDTIPAVNQIELHPYLQQRDVERHNSAYGIRTEAWSPLCRGALPGDPAIIAACTRTSKTVAQVVLRWHVEQGRIVLPRTIRPERMAENLDIFDFSLTSEELAGIDALEADYRIGPHPAVKDVLENPRDTEPCRKSRG